MAGEIEAIRDREVGSNALLVAILCVMVVMGTALHRGNISELPRKGKSKR